MAFRKVMKEKLNKCILKVIVLNLMLKVKRNKQAGKEREGKKRKKGF